jgi:hypothetical protein
MRGLVGVPALWQSWLGGEFDAFSRAFLRKRKGRTESYPCPRECGCAHGIVERRDGALVAVCRCEPWNCDDFAVTAAQASLLELDWRGLGRALCAALKCEQRETDLGLCGARQIGGFSAAAVPVVLSVQDSRKDFNNVVASVASRLGKPFILLAPTSRFVDAGSLGVLKGAGAGFFDLETHVLLMPSGKLQAKTNPMELFAAFVPEPDGQAADDVARQLFGVVKALDSKNVVRKAPVLTVFRLYFVDGLSRAQVAKRCGCVASLITSRIKQIEQTLGKKRDELRGMSSHFQGIEDSLSDSRARRIDRKRSIYGDSPAGEQEE